MHDDDEVKLGDIVSVTSTPPTEAMECTVIYIPRAIGECWRFRDKYGHLHYMPSFRILTKAPSIGWAERMKRLQGHPGTYNELYGIPPGEQ